MVPIGGMAFEPEELSEMFSAASRPTTALAFEAPVDVDLDILFDRTHCRHESENAVAGWFAPRPRRWRLR